MYRSSKLLPAPSSRYFLLLAILLGLIHPQQSFGQSFFNRNDKSYQKDNPAFLKLFEKLTTKSQPSIVEVICNDKTVSLGTVVESDGLILTKASTLSGTPTVRLEDGTEYEATVLGENEGHDLTLLKIDATLKPVHFTPSKEVGVGSWAVSVGKAKAPIALGVISVALRNIPYPKNFRPKQANQNGGYLGIELNSDAKGAVVKNVLPNTGAFRAGLKQDDTILSINGKKISDLDTLRNVLGNFKAKQTVTVRIQRGESEKDLRITLGDRPASRGDIQNRMGSRLSERREGFPTILQHDGIVPPEQCGGPLVDLKGRVIGINICRAGRVESYAIPSEVILPLIQQLKNGSHASTGKKEKETSSP